MLKKLKEFQEFRNKLYHGKNPFWFNKSQKEKENMMKIAMDATDALRMALFSKK